MYTIKCDYLSDFKRITLLNSITGEHVSIVPSYGGNVMTMVLDNENELFNIIEADISKQKLVENCCHRNAKLFPFPNRISDGKYTVNGNTFQLAINQKAENNAIHGFVFDKPFKVVESVADDNMAMLLLEYNYDGTIDGYPFLFNLQIQYKLSKEGFKMKTTVVNTGNANLPMGDGWHPYFSLNQLVNDHYLELPSSKRILVDNRMIPTGEFQIYDTFNELTIIGDTKLDDGFLIEGRQKSVTKLRNEFKDITINVWQDSNTDAYNYLQIYIPPNRMSIAIEPMSCSTNAFNNGKGLTMLNSNEKFEASCGVFLS